MSDPDTRTDEWRRIEAAVEKEAAGDANTRQVIIEHYRETAAGQALREITEDFLSRRDHRGRRLSPEEMRQLANELRAGRRVS